MKIYTEKTIAEAAKRLNEGKLIAFPTETVYGLGANAFDHQAVEEVFIAKGRPNDNPLIVHLARQADVERFATTIDPIEQQLMDAFWPGPLTIIFPLKPDLFPENVNGGKDTIALRVPDNPLTLKLIHEAGVPLVGPSANLSGTPSPTSYKHVVADFDGRIEGVLKNTQPLTKIGLESTVVQVSNGEVLILRPGSITAEMLQAELNIPVKYLSSTEQLNGPLMSPGVKYRHYSPNVPVYVLPSDATAESWQALIKTIEGHIGVFGFDEWLEAIKELPQIKHVYAYGSLKAADHQSRANQRLYDALRTLDTPQLTAIITQAIDESNQYSAYMNRLTKASTYML